MTRREEYAIWLFLLATVVFVAGCGKSTPTGPMATSPDLSLSMTHSANLIQGQSGATYIVTIGNSGTGPTAGVVTVTDTLPQGLTATGLDGTRWSCTLATLSCTRSDVLAAGTTYLPITLTVNVATAAPANVTNVATVTGGGESNTSNNNASDVTKIVPAVPLHGGVGDRAGDTLSDSRVAAAPDLVLATADVIAEDITFVVQLAPGTLDRPTARVGIALDTDQNLSTGLTPYGIGTDYNIDFAVGTGQAAITRADAAGCAAGRTCFNPIGSAPITFIGDIMQVSVSRVLLGNDDGRMDFVVFSYVVVATIPSSSLDIMPDTGRPPGRVQ